MKKIIIVAVLSISIISCKEKSIKESDIKNSQSYIFTLYRDKFDTKQGKFIGDDSTYTVHAENDTTAYLLALNTFYDQKVKQRALLNYGQPKGFLIVDKNNINLSLKLTQRMVDGLQAQVKSKPEVAKMLEEYNQDSTMVR